MDILGGEPEFDLSAIAAVETRKLMRGDAGKQRECIGQFIRDRKSRAEQVATSKIYDNVSHMATVFLKLFKKTLWIGVKI